MLHSAVIEVRQHLCCANVFLKFKESLTDLESLKITVYDNKVQLHNSKSCVEFFVNKFFSILTESFSNLVVDAENASFRISVQDVQLPDFDDNPKRSSLKINLDENEECSLICANCDSVLIAQQKYEKIREFPSGTIDVSEFFCHHGPSFKDILVPAKANLFYGFQFIVVNMAVIEKNIREKENHVYCNRCLRYLGETLFNSRAAKLWCDSILFGLKGENLEIFSTDDSSNFYNIMLKAIEETSLISPEPMLRNIHFTKVLLKAYCPNRLQQYLLLHILEKHLPLLRCNELVQGEMENQKTCFELEQKKAFKLLYRLIAKDEDTNNKETASWPAVLEYWEQDINILKMNISPYLFSSLNKELNKNVNVFPEMYRVNNDDFLLSYIFY